MAASALIGAKVRNDDKETVGKIDDIYLDKDGNIGTIDQFGRRLPRRRQQSRQP